MNELRVTPIKTRIFRPGEKLSPFVKECVEHAVDSLTELEGKLLAVTSKIVSLSENRIIAKGEIDKEALVRRESDHFLGAIGYDCYLTIKHGLFIPSAGIDESNAENDFYILYPVDPFKSAEELRVYLAKAWGLRNFGVVITDSHIVPLRSGVTGVSLAHAGFSGVRSKIGQPDLFKKPLKVTQVNVADALAAAAVYCMGEADEACPLALVSTDVEFLDGNSAVDLRHECRMAIESDLYAPLFKDRL